MQLRQKVVPGIDFEWSDKSWTHNAFRLFEVLFGRGFGSNGVGDTIRRESGSWLHVDENGYEIHFQAFYTLESSVAHVETLVREFLGTFRMPKIYVYTPQMALPGLPFSIPTGYMFAIARDNNLYQNDLVSAGSYSFSYTCTGSNLVLTNFCYSPTGSDTMTSSYNSVSMTLVDASSATNNAISSFVLATPATGANTLTMTSSIGFPIAMSAISYTGAKQTGQPDAHNAGFSNSATSVSVSVTTVANNSWIAGFFYDGNANGSFTASGSFVVLHAGAGLPSSGDWNTLCSLDTNAAITPAGATSVGCAGGGAATQVVLCAISVSPVAAAATRFFTIMGIGT